MKRRRFQSIALIPECGYVAICEEGYAWIYYFANLKWEKFLELPPIEEAPRAVVVHLNKVEMAALEDLKVEPFVYQNLQLGEVFTPPPTPVNKRPWEREGWRNANGECWWSPRKGPAHWRMVDPTIVQAGWLLPHYVIPVIPGGQV
jgi:hypothetical protein